MKKVYFLDFGLRNFLLKKARYNNFDLVSGEEIENFVYFSLMSREKNENIYYYRTTSGSEIDFILAKEGELIPIEVKYRRGIIKTPLAVNNFSKKFKDRVRRRIIITKDYLYSNNNIYFIPAVILLFLRL